MTADMTTTRADAQMSSATIRWHTVLILCALLLVGGWLRFHLITKVGLWPDEFWSSVHLATGRGGEFANLPTGVLLNPPPQTLLAGAPAWWHVWTGLRGIVHPPLYLMLLRWWMDVFGTGDFATRTFSALCSLAGVVVLFDIVRRTISVHAGLLAAALMAIAPLQIDLSQEARPYPLLLLVGLLACQAIIRIEQNGPSPVRLLQLALAFAATALTHYFAFGALLGIVCYVIFQFRGPARRKTLLTIAITTAIVALAWGPFFWQQHHELFRQGAWSLEPSGSRTMAFIRAAAIPSDFLYGTVAGRLGWIAPAVIAYLLPLFWIRRYPQLMLWWFWIVGTIGSILAYDCLNHALLLTHIKYTCLASVGVYALCVVPLPIKIRWPWIVWILPYAILGAEIVAVIMHVQEGPSEANGDWRGLALAVDRYAGPHDPLVFYPDPFWGGSGMYYLDVDHYAANHNRPIMLLAGPPDEAVRKQLLPFDQIWLIGPNPAEAAQTYFPHWRPELNRWFPNSGGLIQLVPGTELTGRELTGRKLKGIPVTAPTSSQP